MIYNINGVEIATSSLGRSGYYGVTLSPAWTLDMGRPFIGIELDDKYFKISSERLQGINGLSSFFS